VGGEKEEQRIVVGMSWTRRGGKPSTLRDNSHAGYEGRGEEEKTENFRKLAFGGGKTYEGGGGEERKPSLFFAIRWKGKEEEGGVEAVEPACREGGQETSIGRRKRKRCVHLDLIKGERKGGIYFLAFLDPGGEGHQRREGGKRYD